MAKESPVKQHHKKKKKTDLHDASYKMVFENMRAVKDLIEGCLGADYAQFDAASLRQHRDEFITEGLERRQVDAVWSGEGMLGGRKILMFVLVEFQTTLPRLLCIRMYDCVNEMYRKWVSQHKAQLDQGKIELPLVLPIVIYSGKFIEKDYAWTDFRKLQVSCDGLLETLQPQQRFWLLDMHKWAFEGDISTNVMACIAHMVQSSSAEDYRKRGYLLDRAKVNWPEALQQAVSELIHNTVARLYTRELDRLNKQPDMTMSEVEKMGASLAQQHFDRELKREVKKGVKREVKKELKKELKREVKKEVLKSKQEIVMKMIHGGLSTSTIAEYSDLSQDEIIALQRKFDTSSS